MFAMALISCENEPVDIPVNDFTDVIEVDSRLFQDIERVVENDLVCIDFRYNFALTIYDENMAFSQLLIMNNDFEFSQTLAAIPSNHSISLSFPIKGVLSNGDVFEINDRIELQERIEDCVKDEVLEYCNGIWSESDCVWRVISEDPETPVYNNSFFQIDRAGTYTYFFEGEDYLGNWVFYFIEEELHLNIFIDDNTVVSQDWNFDWRVTLIDNDNMVITNDISTFALTRKCNSDTDCNSIVYESCVSDTNEMIYELGNYEDCLLNFLDYQQTDPASISYFETIQDAENNENMVPNSYITSSQASFLIARIEQTDTNLIEFVYVKLTGINCE